MPNDTAQEFIQASDNANDYADSLTDALEQTALEDLDNLYNHVDNRDLELWNELGVAPQLVVEDYDLDETRDLNWSLGMSGISAAAITQFVLDNRDDVIIKPVAYREQALVVFTLTRTEMVKAGKRVVETVSTGRYFKLQSKYLEDLAFLKEVSNTQLYNILTDMGAMLPVDQVIASNMDYVARMTPYKPGSTQFKQAVNDLISRDSKRGLKGMNRRAVQQIYTAREIGGDTSTPMVWISEGSHPCDFCRPNAGEVKTYAQWESEGLPGASVCLGGSYCQCHLAAL